MSRGLLNYTTQIAVENTVAEIQGMLVAAGASCIVLDYDAAKNLVSVSFKIETQFGLVPFRLPMNAQAALTVLNKQAYAKQIPKRYINDLAQARRIGWRIIKDWLQAQLALIAMGMVKAEQVFLPYAQVSADKTFFDVIESRRFSDVLSLPEPWTPQQHT